MDLGRWLATEHDRTLDRLRGYGWRPGNFLPRVRPSCGGPRDLVVYSNAQRPDVPRQRHRYHAGTRQTCSPTRRARAPPKPLAASGDPKSANRGSPGPSSKSRSRSPRCSRLPRWTLLRLEMRDGAPPHPGAEFDLESPCSRSAERKAASASQIARLQVSELLTATSAFGQVSILVHGTTGTFFIEMSTSQLFPLWGH